ncbi:putative septum site-determining protein MinC [delta proteobacterium NaphS2]|nr:putative septum site-determining protein MinC [delta proteobacterium NaphS2]
MNAFVPSINPIAGIGGLAKRMNEQGQAVKLKGVGDGLWVTVDPSRSVEVLKRDLETVFNRMHHLSANSSVVLHTETGENQPELLAKLGVFLQERFKVSCVSAPPNLKAPSREDQRTRKRDVDRSWQHHRSHVLMLAGRVRSGQKVTARKHLTIMGDVNPGAEVVAGGDILVMGCLRGKAAAGYPDDESKIVLALDFQPEQLQIGGHVVTGIPSFEKGRAQFAHIVGNSILVEDYLNINPYGRLPWPEVL